MERARYANTSTERIKTADKSLELLRNERTVRYKHPTTSTARSNTAMMRNWSPWPACGIPNQVDASRVDIDHPVTPGLEYTLMFPQITVHRPCTTTIPRRSESEE